MMNVDRVFRPWLRLSNGDVLKKVVSAPSVGVPLLRCIRNGFSPGSRVAMMLTEIVSPPKSGLGIAGKQRSTELLYTPRRL